MGRSQTKDFLILNYLAGVVLLSLAQLALPERYFLDAEGIKTLITESTFQFDFLDSFNNTAYLYKILGLGTVLPDWIAGFLSYSIPFALIGLVAKQQKWIFNSFSAVMFVLWNVLLAVYLGVYSKELWAFIAVALVMLLSKSKPGIVVAMLVALLYATFFRIYWLLVIGFFIVNLWSARTGKSLKFMVAFQIFAAIFVFVLANATTGQYLSETRYNVNLERTDDGVSEAATMINNVFSNDSPIKDWMNGTLIWASLLLPLFLLTTAQVQHIIFFVFQTVNVFAFIKVVKYLLPKTRSRTPRFSKQKIFQVHVAMSWCVAYSFVQGIFEPDFGSFAKHQIILLPMWFTLLSFYTEMKKSPSYGAFPVRRPMVHTPVPETPA